MRYATARQMVFDAYRAGRGSVIAAAIDRARIGAEIQETVRDQNWCIVHGLEAGAVISRVEALAPHMRDLVLVCFGPYTQDELMDRRESVALALYRAFLVAGRRLPGQGKSGPPAAATVEQLRALCQAALYHHSQTTWPYRRQGLSTPQAVRRWMWEECGVNLEGRWSNAGRVDWDSVWAWLCARLDDWEASGLAPVSALARRRAQRTPAAAGA